MLSCIRLNHTRTKQLENPLGFALLFMGIAMGIALFVAVRNLDQQNGSLVQEIQQLQQPEARSRTVRAIDGAGRHEEIAAVKSVIVELSLPWESLFNTLETINIPDVKLVAVEPDLRQSRLRLTAETSDIGAMLLYVERIAKQPIFKDALLLTHEQTANSSMSIRFVVEASWKP
jgi:hypothetical protein